MEENFSKSAIPQRNEDDYINFDGGNCGVNINIYSNKNEFGNTIYLELDGSAYGFTLANIKISTDKNSLIDLRNYIDRKIQEVDDSDSSMIWSTYPLNRENNIQEFLNLLKTNNVNNITNFLIKKYKDITLSNKAILKFYLINNLDLNLFDQIKNRIKIILTEEMQNCNDLIKKNVSERELINAIVNLRDKKNLILLFGFNLIKWEKNLVRLRWKAKLRSEERRVGKEC